MAIEIQRALQLFGYIERTLMMNMFHQMPKREMNEREIITFSICTTREIVWWVEILDENPLLPLDEGWRYDQNERDNWGQDEAVVQVARATWSKFDLVPRWCASRKSEKKLIILSRLAVLIRLFQHFKSL